MSGARSNDDPLKLISLLARVSELASEHSVPSVLAGLCCETGNLEFPGFIDYLESTLRVEDAIFRMTRERSVVQLRFGIGGSKRHTLKEAGVVLGISRERVRQIERRALEKIQAQREELAQHLPRRSAAEVDDVASGHQNRGPCRPRSSARSPVRSSCWPAGSCADTVLVRCCDSLARQYVGDDGRRFCPTFQ